MSYVKDSNGITFSKQNLFVQKCKILFFQLSLSFFSLQNKNLHPSVALFSGLPTIPYVRWLRQEERSSKGFSVKCNEFMERL